MSWQYKNFIVYEGIKTIYTLQKIYTNKALQSHYYGCSQLRFFGEDIFRY